MSESEYGSQIHRSPRQASKATSSLRVVCSPSGPDGHRTLWVISLPIASATRNRCRHWGIRQLPRAGSEVRRISVDWPTLAVKPCRL